MAIMDSCTNLDSLLSAGDNRDFRLLFSQSRVGGSDTNLSRFFLGSNPNRTGSSDQRKRIIANDRGGAFQFELDRVVRKRLNRAELVGDAQNQTSAVRAI